MVLISVLIVLNLRDESLKCLVMMFIIFLYFGEFVVVYLFRFLFLFFFSFFIICLVISFIFDFEVVKLING